ncbi:hypothetical protein Taro_026371 [Colocasia esculenta]|uniref:N-acetyltransferase domain-containing protein n=1 Tax=Colocasia esculenta TaxID=4460 RepID=A0A843VBR3_COLES|nr:hypothetical protein [Colocasia esculenta]
MEGERTKKKVPRTSIALRRFREEDAAALAHWAGDDRILRYFDSLEELAGAGIHAARRHITEELAPNPSFMAICVEGGSLPAGAVSVTMLPYGRDLHRAELGYFVVPELWGRGIATAAVEVAARFAFQRWSHLERLDAVVDVANGASRRVLEKNGFVEEGLLRKYVHTRGRSRDVFMYALLRSDLLDLDDDGVF